jgi:hypothetical protein
LTLAILSVVVGKGRQHDFSVFKDNRLLLHPDALLSADSNTNTIKTRPCQSKRKKANIFRQQTKPIIWRYQNSVFSLNMSTADAKSSGLSKMFIGASTSITR